MRGVILGSLTDDDTSHQAGNDRAGKSDPVLDAQEIQDAESSNGNEDSTDVGT